MKREWPITRPDLIVILRSDKWKGDLIAGTVMETEIALISRGTQPKTKAFMPNACRGNDLRTYYRPTSYELHYVFLWSCGISTLALTSLLSFHPNHCICLAPSIPSPLVVAFAIQLPPTLSFFSLSSSFSLPSSSAPFNLPGLQWRRGRGNSMVTWHPANSLHCQLILAYRYAAVPCQPTSHHAPDISRPVYRAGELQSTYNLQPLALVMCNLSLKTHRHCQLCTKKIKIGNTKRQIIHNKTFIFILLSLFKFD